MMFCVMVDQRSCGNASVQKMYMYMRLFTLTLYSINGFSDSD